MVNTLDDLMENVNYNIGNMKSTLSKAPSSDSLMKYLAGLGMVGLPVLIPYATFLLGQNLDNYFQTKIMLTLYSTGFGIAAGASSSCSIFEYLKKKGIVDKEKEHPFNKIYNSLKAKFSNKRNKDETS